MPKKADDKSFRFQIPTDEPLDRRSGRLRKVLGLVVIVLLLANAAVLGLAYVTHSSLAALLLSPDESNAEKKAGAETASVIGQSPGSEAPIPTKAQGDPRYAFLLLGYGGGDHPGAYLTDSIMVVIVDPSRKTLTLLSLPRDSWVPMLFDGKTPVFNKLNTAYTFANDSRIYPDRLDRYAGKQAAGTFTMDTVSRLLGVPITSYLALDFSGFREMIDAVGGIEVDVPAAFAARYPANDDPSIDPSWMTVRFDKGRQRMNGERAIQYARAREAISNLSEGSDFARSRRQRLIMEAFKARLLQPGGLIHIPELLAIASKHVDTNYAIPAIPQIAQLALEWKDVQFYQAALTNENYLDEGTGPGGAYVLVPSTPDHSWAQIRAYARRLWDDPEAGAAMADTRIVVQNDTGIAGVAGRVTTALANLGYRVGPPITGSVRASSRLVDRSGGKADPVAALLREDLGISLPDVVEPPDDFADLIVEIGSDDVGLANLATSPDDGVPASALGVRVSGPGAPVGEVLNEKPPTVLPTATPRRLVATPTVPLANAVSPTPTAPPAATEPSTSTAAPSTSTAVAMTPSATATVVPTRPSATVPASPTASAAASPTSTRAASATTSTPAATRTPSNAASDPTSTPVATQPASTATPSATAQ